MVKNILSIIICTLPMQLFSQTENNWQLIFLGGVFSPVDDEIENIYGDGPTGKLLLSSPLGEQGRLKFGIGVFSRSGDPFYNSPDFDAGNAADINLTELSLTIETRPLSKGHPILRLGGGIDYVFGTEKITGQESGSGRSIGGHIAFIPEFPISERVSFIAEASYRFLELTLKHDRDRFKLNLSGVNLLIGLGYNF